MVSLTGKSLITRWIPLNDHCFYMLSFSAAEILLHGFLAFLSFFRSDMYIWLTKNRTKIDTNLQ